MIYLVYCRQWSLLFLILLLLLWNEIMLSMFFLIINIFSSLRRIWLSIWVEFCRSHFYTFSTDCTSEATWLLMTNAICVIFVIAVIIITVVAIVFVIVVVIVVVWLLLLLLLLFCSCCEVECLLGMRLGKCWLGGMFTCFLRRQFSLFVFSNLLERVQSFYLFSQELVHIFLSWLNDSDFYFPLQQYIHKLFNQFYGWHIKPD